MKAYLIIAALFMVILLAAQERTVEVQTPELLAKRNGCIQCHSPDNKDYGPSFKEITAKYKNDSLGRMGLIESIRNGSKGKWMEVSRGVPMPRYSTRLSDAEIRQLIDWMFNH